LLIDWLLLSQDFEGGHFKKIENLFSPLVWRQRHHGRLAMDF